MFCNKCGKPLAEGVSFCTACGAPVAPQGQSTPAPEDITQTMEVVETAQTQEVAAQIPAAVEAPEVTEIPEVVAEAPAGKKKAKAAKAAKAPSPIRRQTVPARLGSILLSFLLCACLLFTCTLTVVQLTLTRERISQWVSSVDLTSVNVSVEDQADDSKDVSLTDYLYDLAQTSDLPFELEKKDIEELLSSDVVRTFLNEFGGNYRDALLDGAEEDDVGIDSVVAYIRENENDIRQALEDVGVDTDFEFNYPEIESTLEETMGDALSVKSISENYSGAIFAVRLLFSPVILILSWVICAVMALLLVLTNLRTPLSLLRHIGVPAIMVGVIHLAAGVVGFLVPVVTPLGKSMPFLFGSGSIVNGLCVALLISGAIALAVGIILVVIRVVVGRVAKKRQAAVPAGAAV